MGTLLIIKGADFSAIAVDKVEKPRPSINLGRPFTQGFYGSDFPFDIQGPHDLFVATSKISKAEIDSLNITSLTVKAGYHVRVIRWNANFTTGNRSDFKDGTIQIDSAFWESYSNVAFNIAHDDVFGVYGGTSISVEEALTVLTFS